MVRIENQKLHTRNVSLRMPGELQISKYVLNDTKDSLLVSFNFPLNASGVALIVYLQYGIAPTTKQYDVRFNISREYSVILQRNRNNSCRNDSSADSDMRGGACCRAISETGFHCYNFENFTYGYMKNKEVWFAIKYEGPMPQKTVISNPFTFDEIEVANTMNFTQQLLSPSCKYWNENINQFDSYGLKVGSKRQYV